MYSHIFLLYLIPLLLKETVMPKELENKLKREAQKKGLSGKRIGAYVYGTMQKIMNRKSHGRGK